jgi:protein phosphatase
MNAFRVMPSNAQHQGSRGEQQDAFAFSDPKAENAGHAGFLALVADGMGGMSSGREASITAARVFLDAYAKKAPEEPIFDALKRAALRANEAVLEIGNDVSAPGEAGTTLVAAVVHEGALYWLSIGDSRVYLLDAKSITRLNEEHNLKSRLLRLARQGLSDAEEAETHPQRDALTSYVGIEELTEIDTPDDALRLKVGDQVILCSDGLYRALSEDEIFETARHAFGGDTAFCLVERAVGKGLAHQDNVTAVTLSIVGDGGAKTPQADESRNEREERVRPAKDPVISKPDIAKKKNFPWLFCFILVMIAAGAAVAALLPYLKNYFGGGN